MSEVAWGGSGLCGRVGSVGWVGLHVLGLRVLCSWVLLHVLVLVLVGEAWSLYVWVLHVLVLEVWVLDVLILQVWVLLLRSLSLSLIGLCLGGLSPDEVFLLHIGGVIGKLCAVPMVCCGTVRDWWFSCGEHWWNKELLGVGFIDLSLPCG